MSFSKFSAEFTLSEITAKAAIMVSNDVLEKVRAHGQPCVKFHKSNKLEFTVERTSGSLNIKSTVSDEKMMAYIRIGKKLIISFSRMGLTNFKKTNIPLAEGVNILCPEMFFMLEKCFFQREVSTNCKEIQFDILTAKEPRFAKSAGNKLDNFNAAGWDSGVSRLGMFATTLASLADKETFNDFKVFADMIGDAEEVLVVEANDDVNWGINKFTTQFLEEFEPLIATSADPEAEFFDIAKSLFGGKNMLGELLTPIILAVRGMDYDQYMREIDGVKFVSVEPFSGSDEHDSKRVCSERTCS